MNYAFRRVISAVGVTSVASALDNNRKQTRQVSCQANDSKRSKLIFLGTGSSTGCPKPLCTMLFQGNSSSSLSESQQEFIGICKVSNLAIQGNPRDNKDYRNNPSLLIQHYNENDSQVKNIVIDVGKTFREGALRWFPFLGIQSLDAIVLTHHHMDAVAGLDDVRGFQRFSGLNREEPPKRIPISVFLSQECLDQVSSQFPWLFPNQQQQQGSDTLSESDKPEVKRDVAALNVNVVQDYQPFTAAGLEMVPLPVWHGSDLISLGFSFSLRGQDGTLQHVVYISDISKMVPETLEYIKKKLPPTSILIVDCLLPAFHHPVHYSLNQAVALSQEIQAKRTFLIGMSCDAFSPHDEMNAELSKKYGGTIQFAHDGQVLHL